MSDKPPNCSECGKIWAFHSWRRVAGLDAIPDWATVDNGHALVCPGGTYYRPLDTERGSAPSMKGGE